MGESFQKTESRSASSLSQKTIMILIEFELKFNWGKLLKIDQLLNIYKIIGLYKSTV